MSPSLPILSAKEIIKALKRGGYIVARQRGSHVRLINPARKQWPVTVPNHKIIGRGLIRKIINDTDLSVEQFLELL